MNTDVEKIPEVQKPATGFSRRQLLSLAGSTAAAFQSHVPVGGFPDVLQQLLVYMVFERIAAGLQARLHVLAQLQIFAIRPGRYAE